MAVFSWEGEVSQMVMAMKDSKSQDSEDDFSAQNRPSPNLMLDMLTKPNLCPPPPKKKCSPTKPPTKTLYQKTPKKPIILKGLLTKNKNHHDDFFFRSISNKFINWIYPPPPTQDALVTSQPTHRLISPFASQDLGGALDPIHVPFWNHGNLRYPPPQSYVSPNK